MILVAILLALLIEHFTAQLAPERELGLARGYVRRLRRLLPGQGPWVEWPAVLLLVGPPVAAVWWLERQVPYPFGWLGLSVLVLWLCLGPRDLSADLHRLLAARDRGDQAGVLRVLRRLQRGPDAAEPSARSLTGAMFVQSHERLFAILLFFFVLGPAGALFYRLISRLPPLLEDEHGQPTPGERFAETLHGLAAWLPARITALLFGLAGSLDDALAAWRRLGGRPDHGWRSQTWAVLAETAGGSLLTEGPDGAPMVPASLDALSREVLALQRRALTICLAFFVFFATGGWLQ